MDATLIVIDSDAELARARSLVDRLMASDDPRDLARLQTQFNHYATIESLTNPASVVSRKTFGWLEI